MEREGKIGKDGESNAPRSCICCLLGFDLHGHLRKASPKKLLLALCGTLEVCVSYHEVRHHTNLPTLRHKCMTENLMMFP